MICITTTGFTGDSGTIRAYLAAIVVVDSPLFFVALTVIPLAEYMVVPFFKRKL